MGIHLIDASDRCINGSWLAPDGPIIALAASDRLRKCYSHLLGGSFLEGRLLGL